MDITTLQQIGANLRQKVFGNEELITALVAAYYKRLAGMPSNLLVFGPPGVGKTVASKNFAQIASEMNGGRVIYARIQGRPDLMPEEIIADRVVQYDDSGRPGFGYQLGNIAVLRKENNLLPAILHVDEIDRVTSRAQAAFLEIMEEQQATVDGKQIPLNFVMVATANTRKYDATCNAIPKPVQDRFRAGTIHVWYNKPEADRQILDWHVNSWGMPVESTDNLLTGMVTVVKLTQQKMAGYSDFTPYIKVPAGPRGILDLYSESATKVVLEGRNIITPQDVIAIGVRILRGRVEVTPDAEVNGKTVDTVITEILYEVFGDMGDQGQEPSDESEGSSEDSTSEADKHSFTAGFRKEMNKDKESDKQDPR